MKTRSQLPTITLDQLTTVTGGLDLTAAKNAARGFAGGLGCLAKFTVDGTPGTNTYDTYLACQRKAHQF